MLREKDAECLSQVTEQKQEFEGLASTLREQIKTLEEEKAAIVSQKESLEGELRATIRSIESNWNGNHPFRQHPATVN